MRIGIDIDNTLVNTNDVLMEHALEFDKKYVKGKGFKDKNKYNFVDMFYWDREDVKKFFSIVCYDETLYDLKPNNTASEVTHKLHDEGHEIIIITYREDREGIDVYGKTKDMLIKNNIYFDKLITNSGAKGIVCKNEGIDVFIDDSYTQCMDAINHGIKHVLMYRTDFNKESKLYALNNWDEIYDYIRRIDDGKNS